MTEEGDEPNQQLRESLNETKPADTKDDISHYEALVHPN